MASHKKDDKMKRDKLARYEKLVDEIIESLENIDDNEYCYDVVRMLLKKIKKEIELIDEDKPIG